MRLSASRFSLIKKLYRWILHNPFVIGLLCLLWFALRTGTKPSRAVYPCQRAAAASGYVWLSVYAFPLISAIKHKTPILAGIRNLLLILLAVLAVVSLAWSFNSAGHSPGTALANQFVQLDITGRLAVITPASDIFVVNGTSGNDRGMAELITLMRNQGTLFYRSRATATDKEPTGIISGDDTIIVKVNSQWDARGGTNTDLLRALIQSIVQHPDGFTGEIVVADNGQAQYGANGSGGNLDYRRNNAEDTAQSVQKVVDSFAGSYKVSTYLWDTITTQRVNEYRDSDSKDGYVLETGINPRTSLMVSYPKFTTRFGTAISFKLGVWNPGTQTYDSERLKVINVPVLKTHGGYGVTASVKHYMGVTSDKLTAQLGARSHNAIGAGGMGTEMVETMYPALNIIDAIWINANPGRGPSTSYDSATRTGIIAAGTDPVALDYWAAKYILMPAAQNKGFTSLTSIDPDNTASGSFAKWLRLSMQEINLSGRQTTVDEDRMNIYTSRLEASTSGITSVPADTSQSSILSPVSPATTIPVVSPASQPLPASTNRIYNLAIVVPAVLVAAFLGIITYRKRKQRP